MPKFKYHQIFNIPEKFNNDQLNNAFKNKMNEINNMNISEIDKHMIRRSYREYYVRMMDILKSDIPITKYDNKFYSMISTYQEKLNEDDT